MKLSVDLNEEQMLRLKKRTEHMSINPEQFLAQLLEPYTNSTDEEFQLLENIANQFQNEINNLGLDEDEDEDWDEDDEDEDEDWDEDEEEWEDDEEWDDDDEEWEEDEDWDEDDWDEDEEEDDEDFEAVNEAKIYSLQDSVLERIN